MINNFQEYLTLENIFLFSNWGVIPFWLLMLFSPNGTITRFLVHSVLIPLLLGSAYVFVVYKSYMGSFDFGNNFGLYLGLMNLSELFSNQEFLIVFWIHFLSINLFCGSWMSRDGSRLMISKYLMFFPIVVTYFVGPVGIFIYWVVRIFYAKKISLYE